MRLAGFNHRGVVRQQPIQIGLVVELVVELAGRIVAHPFGDLRADQAMAIAQTIALADDVDQKDPRHQERNVDRIDMLPTRQKARARRLL